MYRVLLVEDDAAMRFVYSKMKTWVECGFEIAAEAKNGKDALEILQKQSFDLIFTDIRMPFIDGIELLRKLEPLGITTTVIFASSYNEFEYARQGLILGAFDYILKPVDEKKMRNVLERVKIHLDTIDKEKLEESIIHLFQELEIDPNSGKFVHQVAVYLSKQYGEIITMEDISEELGFSKDYFGKVFKQQFGMTFHDFYARVKISYAIDLMRTGNYKAYQISEILGYSSTDYFTKVFKEITGKTPSKYKSELEK